MFHSKYPEINMAINITRYPFSFRGDRPLDDLINEPPDTILTNVSPDENRPSTLQMLGNSAGISFNIDSRPFYNPINAQRSLLWAARFGKQEDLAEVNNY